MVLHVKPTPTRFPTNSLYTPMDNTPLHSISSMCHPWVYCLGMSPRDQFLKKSAGLLHLTRDKAIVVGLLVLKTNRKRRAHLLFE